MEPHVELSLSQEAFASMELIDKSLEPFTCKDDKVQPGDLLEQYWFFGNLLDRKTRMSRCYSEPCPSSNYSHEEMLVGKSYEEAYSSIKKLSAEGGKLTHAGLIRTPSLSEESTQARGSHPLHRASKSSLLRSSPNNNLLRAPSLPSSIGWEETIQDEESDFSMSRLIRQASLKQSDKLPPRHVAKAVTQSCSSTPRHRPRRKQELEIINTPSSERLVRQQSINRSKLTKSSSDLNRFQELQGLRDFSIQFEKYVSDSNEAKIINHPGMQVKKQIGFGFGPYEEKARKDSSSEAWQTQSTSSPVPDWAGNRSADDMKAQIKFWARAVASNADQEC